MNNEEELLRAFEEFLLRLESRPELIIEEDLKEFRALISQLSKINQNQPRRILKDSR